MFVMIVCGTAGCLPLGSLGSSNPLNSSNPVCLFPIVSSLDSSLIPFCHHGDHVWPGTSSVGT